MPVRDAVRLARWQRVADLWNAGYSSAAIAIALKDGTTRSGICGLVSRLRDEGWKLERRGHGKGGLRPSVTGYSDDAPPPVPARLLKADPATAAVVVDPWRCRTPSCGRTRQPGRDFCAECITAAQAQRRTG